MAKDIEQSYELEAGTDQIFRELTETELLDRWWTTSSRSEASEGGSFEYVWEFEDAARNGRQSGNYTEFVAGKRLSYPWDGGGFDTHVEFTLEPSGHGSVLHLSHTGWADAPDSVRDQIDQGWAFFLGNLVSVVNDGKDGRVAVLGQKVKG